MKNYSQFESSGLEKKTRVFAYVACKSSNLFESSSALGSSSELVGMKIN